MQNKLLLLVLFFSWLTFGTLPAQNPLEELSYYIGTWSLPKDDPFREKHPKFKDLKVIDFEWGTEKRVIHSRTGLYSKEGKKIFSEGIITYNPTTNKLMWLEFQIDGTMLFEGEYRLLGEHKVQREYTVHYPKGDKTIPHPELSGWTRLYRETFIPTSENSIDWITEIYINGEWKPGISGGDSKAVRDNKR